MGDWPYSDHDDDTWDEAGYHEAHLIEEGIREQSESSVQWALGTYGDAATHRVVRLLDEADRMIAANLHGASLATSYLAVELVVRYLVVTPLVQGAFLSDEWAEILAARIVGGASSEDRRLLPAVARQWGLDLSAVRTSDGAEVWPQVVGPIRRKRNRVMHEGEEASEEEARRALEAARALLHDFCGRLARRFGFDWPARSWSGDIVDTRDQTVAWRRYHPLSPFERRGSTSPGDSAGHVPVNFDPDG